MVKTAFISGSTEQTTGIKNNVVGSVLTSTIEVASPSTSDKGSVYICKTSDSATSHVVRQKQAELKDVFSKFYRSFLNWVIF